MGNLFELEDLGAQDLKGIAGSARAWAAYDRLLLKDGLNCASILKLPQANAVS